MKMHMNISEQEISAATILAMTDDEQILKFLGRYLGVYVESLLLTLNHKEASRLLRENKVTHVLYDYDFGKNEPDDLNYVRSWIKDYPTIQRSIVLTGPGPFEITAEDIPLFQKPISLIGLLDALQIWHECTNKQSTEEN